ncbi:PREDICTED: collagen alpha-1(VII) chain-like, partial [Thamnophis sirtalis]|uniref:Collagen alpha-1(VII) chain-like n=1 Tax=Thamnophis sirtalis TaxID=35019 RepID=A0A6I9Z549_9SAUR
TLLEAESTRLQLPATDLQLARGLRDVTTESTLSRLQGPSVDRGRTGSRDVRPSPATLPKLRGFQSKVESPSWGAKTPSSAAREFQKANASLRHSQAAKSPDGLLPPPKEPSAFRLDSSSQHSQRVTVTHSESLLAQSVFCPRPPLAFNSVKEEASMVTEAVETAIQEVKPRETHLEPSLLQELKSQAGVSSDSSSSLGEENGLPPSSTEGLEKALQDHRGEGQPTDPLEEFQVCEDFAEVNGGQEAWAELQGAEEAWGALEAEAPLALGAELLRAERMEGGGGGDLLPGEADEENGSPEWKEREEPALLGGTLGSAVGEAAEKSEFATEADAHVNGSQEGWELGGPPTDILEGAPEGNMEEVYGGAEEVEMLSPEDLSEKREPPREDDKGGLQAEPLEVEGSPAKEDWSTTTHTALSAGDHQKTLFPEEEQETFESREELLHEADSALPEGEGKGPDATEEALPGSSGPAVDEDGLLADEPKGAESREEEEEEKGGDVDGPLPTEDRGDEGTMEAEGYLDLEAPKSTLELGATVPGEDAAILQLRETLGEDQRREVAGGGGLEPLEEQEGGGGWLPEIPLQAEGSNWEERDLVSISGGPGSEDLMEVLQMEEVHGAVVAENLLQKEEGGPEDSEDKGRGLDDRQAGEQPLGTEDPSREETTWPEEALELAEAPAEDSIPHREEDSGTEETLGHSDFLPNGPRERGGTGEEDVQLGQLASDHALTLPEAPSLPSLESEEEAPLLEEDTASLLLVKGDGGEEGPPGGERGCSPQEDGPCSEEPLAAEGSAEAVIQRQPFTADGEDRGPGEAEQEGLEGAPGLEAEEDPWQEGEAAKGPVVPTEEVAAELRSEPGDGFGSPADGCDPSYSQQEEEEEEEEEEDQGPLGSSDQEPPDVGPAKVSPLTSVTDLGEIVLEGDGAVESDTLGPCEDECFHVFDAEDLIQQKFVAVEDPPGTGSPERFPEEVLVGLPLESKGDPNILEIVEQALEFNQELMKAAEEERGGPGKEAQGSPEERSPPAHLDQGPTQVPTEAPEGSPPIPREAHPSGESQANGLQEEPILDEFPSELLNGLGQGKADPPPEDEDFIKEVTIAPQFCPEDSPTRAETLSQSPPPVPAGEEGFRSGGTSPEVLEKVSLDQELLDEDILDDLRQKTCVKGGKDTNLEPMPFLFGDEIRRQPLEFRPEGDLDLQPSEDD